MQSKIQIGDLVRTTPGSRVMLFEHTEGISSFSVTAVKIALVVGLDWNEVVLLVKDRRFFAQTVYLERIVI